MYYSKVDIEIRKYEISGNLLISESVLESVESTSFIGICIDENLTWKKHINSVCNVFKSNKKMDFCIEHNNLFQGKP